MTAASLLRRVGLLLLPLSFGFAVAGCGSTDQAEAESADLYQVSGEVIELPAVDSRRPRLEIRHGAIPDFKNRAGEVEGMKAMTMSFDLAPDLALETLSVGDPIDFTLEVVWSRESPARIIAWSRPSDG